MKKNNQENGFKIAVLIFLIAITLLSLFNTAKLSIKKESVDTECRCVYETQESIRLSSRADRMTQDQAIAYWKEKGLNMLSGAGMYSAIKSGSEEDKAKLKQVLKDSWLITSTRIVYNANNLNAEIIHNYGTDSQTSISMEVPVIDGSMEDAPEKLLQALFGTTDSKEQIIKNLKAFGGERTLYFWTPSQSWRKDYPGWRKDYPGRVFGVGFINSVFGFGAYGWTDLGNSFGVLSDSEPKARSII